MRDAIILEGAHSERLGHSSIAITLDVYSHVLPVIQAEAAEKLDAALGGVIE